MHRNVHMFYEVYYELSPGAQKYRVKKIIKKLSFISIGYDAIPSENAIEP